MNLTQQPYFVHAATPLHVGIEDSLGGIDLPTMRERHTGYPLLPGSSIKGVLRAEAENDLKSGKIEALAAFGPSSDLSGDYRGGLVLTDALLLALPVRSLAGTFSWVSCPQLLRRLRRDLLTCNPGVDLTVPQVQGNEGLVPAAAGGGPESDLLVTDGGKSKVFLEELLLAAQADADVALVAERIAEWGWRGDAEGQAFFRRRFLVIADDLFSFLSRLALEVRARVKIDRERGTAADTGPWTEEHMPAETLLYGLAIGRKTTHIERPKPEAECLEGAQAAGSQDKKTRRDAHENLAYLQTLCSGISMLRFGGHSSIGLGRAFFRLVDLGSGAGAKGGGK